jgi:hypothetical protein
VGVLFWSSGHGISLGSGVAARRFYGAPRMALRRCELPRVSLLLGDGRGDVKRLPGAEAARKAAPACGVKVKAKAGVGTEGAGRTEEGVEDGAGSDRAGAGSEEDETEREEDETERAEAGVQGEKDGVESDKTGTESEEIGDRIEEDGTNGIKLEKSGTEREEDGPQSEDSGTPSGEDRPRSEEDGEALRALSASRRSADTLAGDGTGIAAPRATSEGDKVLNNSSAYPPKPPSSTSSPPPSAPRGASRDPSSFLTLASSALTDSSSTSPALFPS